jgi:hypothetical protein
VAENNFEGLIASIFGCTAAQIPDRFANGQQFCALGVDELIASGRKKANDLTSSVRPRTTPSAWWSIDATAPVRPLTPGKLPSVPPYRCQCLARLTRPPARPPYSTPPGTSVAGRLAGLGLSVAARPVVGKQQPVWRASPIVRRPSAGRSLLATPERFRWAAPCSLLPSGST